ncbi:MAG: HdeD family acid-resistance protein [Breznakia sp.]
MKKRSKFGYLELCIGILFIGMGMYTLANPVVALGSMVIMFGFTAITRGIGHFIMYISIKREESIKTVSLLVVGIFDVVIGIMLISNIKVGILTISFLFPFWFMMDCFVNIMNASIIKKAGGIYWLVLIMNIFGIVLASMLIFNLATSALTFAYLIAWYLLILGFRSLVVAFSDVGSQDYPL